MLDFTVQFLAAGLLFLGIYYTGNHRKIGPLMAAVAEVCVVTVGIWYGTWSIVVIGVGLFILQVRMLWKWQQEGFKW